MKKVLLIAIWIIIINKANPQGNSLYQTGLTAEQNLKAIGSLVMYTTGGVGFDTRYEGVKGSPALFDKLVPSMLKVKGENYYIQLETNIDLIQNTLIFKYPKTGQMLLLPYNKVGEVIVKTEGKEMIIRTPVGKNLAKEFREHKFFQVLKEGKFQFIKIPVKKLIAADYKDPYSADRRFDEYTIYYKYYIMSSDSSLQQIQLTKKSLIRMFPGKKELINSTAESKSWDNPEEMVLAFLEKL